MAERAAGAVTLVDVALRDGSTVRVRPVTAADAEALAAFLRELSPDDRRYRFFGTVDPDAAARAMAAATGSDDHGLVALSGVPERVVAHAQYSRPPGGTVAEVAPFCWRTSPSTPTRRGWSCSTHT
jgi:hypothetical protein